MWDLAAAHSVLCCAVLCCAVLCRAVLCCAVLCCSIQHTAPGLPPALLVYILHIKDCSSTVCAVFARECKGCGDVWFGHPKSQADQPLAKTTCTHSLMRA